MARSIKRMQKSGFSNCVHFVCVRSYQSLAINWASRPSFDSNGAAAPQLSHTGPDLMMQPLEPSCNTNIQRRVSAQISRVSFRIWESDRIRIYGIWHMFHSVSALVNSNTFGLHLPLLSGYQKIATDTRPSCKKCWRWDGPMAQKKLTHTRDCWKDMHVMPFQPKCVVVSGRFYSFLPKLSFTSGILGTECLCVPITITSPSLSSTGSPSTVKTRDLSQTNFHKITPKGSYHKIAKADTLPAIGWQTKSHVDVVRCWCFHP